MNRGWIKIWRKSVDNPLYSVEPFDKWHALEDLVLLANHKEGLIVLKNGLTHKIKRGECGYSQKTLSDRWKWSRGKVARFLKLLTSLKVIEQKSVHNHTIITILNYEQFQGDSAEHKPEKKEDLENFEIFYSLYPRKEAKKNALKSYQRAIKSGVTHETIMGGVQRYIDHLTEKKVDKKYYKLPATWLNQGCWEDEYRIDNSIQDLNWSI